MDRDTYRTPQFIFNQLNAIFNFTLDGACDDTNHKCDKWFTNSLENAWSNERVFCNPPFSKKDEFISKAVHEVENNQCPIVVMILPLNSISSPVVYDNIIDKGYRYDILRQRISFLDNNNCPVSGNNTGTVIVYFMKSIRTKEE